MGKPREQWDILDGQQMGFADAERMRKTEKPQGCGINGPGYEAYSALVEKAKRDVEKMDNDKKY